MIGKDRFCITGGDRFGKRNPGLAAVVIHFHRNGYRRGQFVSAKKERIERLLRVVLGAKAEQGIVINVLAFQAVQRLKVPHHKNIRNPRPGIKANGFAGRFSPLFLTKPGAVTRLKHSGLLHLMLIRREQKHVAGLDFKLAPLFADAAFTKQQDLSALTQGANRDRPFFQGDRDGLGKSFGRIGTIGKRCHHVIIFPESPHGQAGRVIALPARNLPYNEAMTNDLSSSVKQCSAVLVIHGGAGTIRSEIFPPHLESEYRAALEAALRAGYAALMAPDGTALNGVETAVRYLEDCPLFNAARGAVFTHEGRNEMDAAIMDGATGRAGAVTGVTTVRNPVTLARAILEQSPFVMLAGKGAEEFAAHIDIDLVDPEYFRTEDRWRQLQTQLAREAESGTPTMSLSEDNKFGTVGAVAVDRSGNVAAATSTGGMTNKRFGRIGDSPVIGAGTWADNATCAVSATGHGEFFIRCAVAHDIAARIAYGGRSVAQAAHEVIQERLPSVGGDGGVIAIDAHGNATLPFNTEGMYRGYITAEGDIRIGIYQEPER